MTEPNPIKLARTPTPLHLLQRLSDDWNSRIWIKRDDLTGSGLTGNKVRKLEYLLADALRLEADTLITCGGVQSNHCRATAIVAAQNNLNCRLLLRGAPVVGLDGNYLLDLLCGAGIEFIAEDQYYQNLSFTLESIAGDVRSKGGRPYIIPEGGSNPLGALGYVQALRELKQQCDEVDLHPDTILCASGSGGTHAGLWLGSRMEDWDVTVKSVSVCYGSGETQLRVHDIVRRTIQEFEIPVQYDPDDIRIIDGYRGPGYARADTPVFETIREVATREGILLEPVYTGKAARALREEILKGKLPGVTVFWHTGGIFGLFPFHREFGLALR